MYAAHARAELTDKQPTCQTIAHVHKTKTWLRTSGCFLIPTSEPTEVGRRLKAATVGSPV